MSFWCFCSNFWESFLKRFKSGFFRIWQMDLFSCWRSQSPKRTIATLWQRVPPYLCQRNWRKDLHIVNFCTCIWKHKYQSHLDWVASEWGPIEAIESSLKQTSAGNTQKLLCNPGTLFGCCVSNPSPKSISMILSSWISTWYLHLSWIPGS